ncbi:YaiI/YqxD family protein [Paenibacillus sp. HN-1]|uniref:YaiI/YqxD family protein n=1 Tax=Paenibacillus TaxID=44249 RepID=UPI001CA9527A|nr:MULTISPECIES: YaiI/YqxD family protein [Paenibacillus]MBY9076922.1 YaiI/YqxD family protein [Paenibacillus sp. CGMCC 1.18879]MBY9086187.1 YaiI/YqxD family protein [Paenibacillus sinensis]
MTSPGETVVVVDADACPVKKETAETARSCGIPVLMVSSYAHELQSVEGVDIVHVDNSDQSADLYIVNHVKRGDVVLTSDYGLAAMALAKGCHVLSFRGQTYDEGNMDMMLEGRHARAKERRRGHYSKGPKPFTEEDRRFFQHKLTKLLRNLQENVQP